MASARKIARPPTVRTMPEAETSPDVAKPVKTASMIHPTTSLAMPAATVIWPKSRRIKPSSLRILAITASAETARAAATNRAKTVRSLSGPMNDSGRTPPTTRPPINGTTRLKPVTSAAARPRRRIRPRSVSKPAVTSRNATPSQLTAKSAPELISCSGRNHSKPSVQTRPKIDGPRITPAPSWPITEGRLRRRITAPQKRAAATKTRSWVQKTSNSCSSSGVSANCKRQRSTSMKTGAWSEGGSSLGPLRSLRSISASFVASVTEREVIRRSMRSPIFL